MTPNRHPRLRKLVLTDPQHERNTHYLFRFPAKFHPPVVRTLLETWSAENDTVLDPFCGSGTLLVEAALASRSAIGVDVDPLAVLVSAIKSHPLKLPALRKTHKALLLGLERLERPPADYERFMHTDITEKQAAEELGRLRLPQIPNIDHWFRRYVSVDLARLLHVLNKLDVPSSHQRFLQVVFASIIRSCSNADPVPVSGLEVTSHMKKRDEKGRLVNPFLIMRKATSKAINAMEAYSETVPRPVDVSVWRHDATRLTTRLRREVDAVITSPPYHGAVDYYRRHTLETYWLGLTPTHPDRLALLPQYIGRAKVPQSHPFVKSEQLVSGREQRIERKIRDADQKRADAFKHYCVAMRKTAVQLAKVLRPGSPAVFVVGHSSWNGDRLNTSHLFEDLASPYFELEEQRWYPVKNRYMSYSRHNGADINREFVLAFKRTRTRVAPT